jgi:hypothetical protein
MSEKNDVAVLTLESCFAGSMVGDGDAIVDEEHWQAVCEWRCKQVSDDEAA